MTDKRYDSIRPIRWDSELGQLQLIDQRLLPQQELYIYYSDVRAVADAIRDMVVRGAPAIGITAAYGVVLAVRKQLEAGSADWRTAVEPDLEYLGSARPTAVNLMWAIKRMRDRFSRVDSQNPVPELLAEAHAIMAEDIAANHKMGELGAALIEQGSGAVLTHCNAGALATGGYGTALGVVRRAVETGRINELFADETRPWLQGARLTAWEMVQESIPVTLLADGAAAHLLKSGRIGWVVVGSDRIAANGDVANKIGTYGVAIAAKHHGVKVMVVAPTSTVDMSLASGDLIPIEQRGVDEVFGAAGERIAAEGAQGWNPAFDVTPAGLVDAIVTEKGVVLNPTTEKMAAMMKNGS
jgi:methylthioribose-1-phosphate isomerase